jgi:hypothetical protein
VTKASAQRLTGIAASTAAGEALGATPGPREVGLAIGHRLKAQPISPEQAARVALLVMAGAVKTRSERDEPAA